MKKKIYLVFTIFILVSLSCSTPAILQRETSTPTLTATLVVPTETATPLPTNTPEPTPTPTPLPIVRIENADQTLLLGDYQGAISEYQNGFIQAQDDETRSAALAGIGFAYYLLENYDEALEAFNTLVEVYGNTPSVKKAYFYLGEIYTSREDYSNAALAYQGFLDSGYSILNFYIEELLGDTFMQLEDYEGAVQAYERSAAGSVLNDTDQSRINAGQAYAALGNYEKAILIFLDVYETTSNDYVKAQVNLLAGQAYLAIGEPEQAYARFQDSVTNYPLSYDSYSGLVSLVNAGEAVDDLDRGLVNYFAGQYGLAIDAFERYIKSGVLHDGTVHHYLAMSYIVTGDIDQAIEEWENIINDHLGDRFWVQAWDEIAYAQWAYLGWFETAAQTYLDFVNRAPDADEAPTYLYRAARIYERNNDLEEAAANWERMIIDYPSNELSSRGLFLAGICYYRIADYESALTTFQRVLILSAFEEDQAAAYLWIGKIYRLQGDEEKAVEYWQQAANLDPTGYYGERAKEVLMGQNPLGEKIELNYEYDLESEKHLAESWLRSTFEIPFEVNLDEPGPLEENIHYQLGNAYWNLGLYQDAYAEFELLRQDVSSSPENSFRLISVVLEKDFYRLAILTSRNVLDLANLDDEATLRAPVYFNHIRFGFYYKDLILGAADESGIDPLLLFCLVRQESFFDQFAGSSAGATGLMQLIPGTAQDMVSYLGWPDNYQYSDLHRPNINLVLGSRYLKRQKDYFGGNNLYAMLSAYNAGPGNAEGWNNISKGDPDLFFEAIRFAETRDYVQYIYEVYHIYQSLYSADNNE